MKRQKKSVNFPIPIRSTVQLVDLGLPSGTLWADRNLGANKPEELGNYFRFGEVIPFTKESGEYEYPYPTDNIAGTENDAATHNLGKPYKMPSIEQLKELFSICKKQWTSQNGVAGCKLTGPNGNSIFLPASGLRLGVGDAGIVTLNGIFGFYWSASLNYDENYGKDLYFDSACWYDITNARSEGRSVRPVSG